MVTGVITNCERRRDGAAAVKKSSSSRRRRRESHNTGECEAKLKTDIMMDGFCLRILMQTINNISDSPYVSMLLKKATRDKHSSCESDGSLNLDSFLIRYAV